MGVIYSIACRKCMVVRDLDKLHKTYPDVTNRDAALFCAQEITKDSFRAGLIISFMHEHKGHDCVMFDDTFDDDLEQELGEFSGNTKRDGNFWGKSYEDDATGGSK